MIREADAQALRAASLNDIGRYAEALEVVDPALLVHPEHVELLVQAAVALDATGRSADAVVPCREAVRLSPQDVRAWRLLARILIATADLEGAHQAVSTALTLAPGDPFSLLELSRVETARGHREPAVEAAERALELAPGLDTAHLQLAAALTSGRRRPDSRTLRRAEQLVKEVLRDHPGDETVQRELERVRALRAPRPAASAPPGSAPAPRRREGPAVVPGGLVLAAHLAALAGAWVLGRPDGRSVLALAVVAVAFAGVLAGLALGRVLAVPVADGSSRLRGLLRDEPVGTLALGLLLVDGVVLAVVALAAPTGGAVPVAGLPMVLGVVAAAVALLLGRQRP